MYNQLYISVKSSRNAKDFTFYLKGVFCPHYTAYKKYSTPWNFQLLTAMIIKQKVFWIYHFI